MLAFIAALFLEVEFKELTNEQKKFISNASNSLSQEQLYVKTEVVAGLVFGTSIFAVLIGIVALLLRLQHDTHYDNIFFSLVMFLYMYINCNATCQAFLQHKYLARTHSMCSMLSVDYAHSIDCWL